MNIVELTKNTAGNIHDLLMQLANHIAALEAENAELKHKLKAYDDDLK